MTIWYNMCSFGKCFPVLISCTEKNLATLHDKMAMINCKYQLPIKHSDNSLVLNDVQACIAKWKELKPRE
jgi:hypothetical protein